MRIRMEVVAKDAGVLFPGQTSGKIVSAGRYLYVCFESDGRGSVVMQSDGKEWRSKAEIPIGPPYMAVDHRGYVHVAGISRKKRDQVWHYQTAQPHALDTMDDGLMIHPRNYSALVVDKSDDTLYYFGATLTYPGIAFMSRPANGAWSKPQLILRGQVFYPSVVIRDRVIHLIFTGWDSAAALYEGQYYLRSIDQGKTWMRGDGTPIKTPYDYNPIKPESVAGLEQVNRSFVQGHFETNNHLNKFFVDRQGRPHAIYGFVPSYFPSPEPDPPYKSVHARRDAGGWKYRPFPKGIAGASIGVDAAGGLHCFSELGYQISTDGGDHWSAAEPVTDLEGQSWDLQDLRWAEDPFQGEMCFVYKGAKGLCLGRFPVSEKGSLPAPASRK